MNYSILSLTLILLCSNTLVFASEIIIGDIDRGRQLWNMETIMNGDARSCASCHTSEPQQSGKHVRTGKSIEPMSPAVIPSRLTEPKKVEKWFRRNCKWTMARECTADEKADILAFLKSK